MKDARTAHANQREPRSMQKPLRSTRERADYWKVVYKPEAQDPKLEASIKINSSTKQWKSLKLKRAH